MNTGHIYSQHGFTDKASIEIAKRLEIEGFHHHVRKVTKIKGAFSSDMALLKLIYLAHKKTLRRTGRCHWPIGEQQHQDWPFVPRENGVRFAVAIRGNSQPHGTESHPLTPVVLHSLIYKYLRLL